MSIIIRSATAADLDFIVTAIMEAEKGASGNVSYCRMFSITEVEFRNVLLGMLEEEVPGQELYLPGFLIAEMEGRPVAASCSWVEKAEGMASNMIKSNLLMYTMDRKVMLDAMPMLAIVNEVNIDREDGALQIESIYTAEGYRGRGLTQLLIEAHIEKWQQEGLKLTRAQIMLMEHNAGAKRAYEKAGFVTAKRKSTSNKAILEILGGDTKILMERTIN